MTATPRRNRTEKEEPRNEHGNEERNEREAHRDAAGMENADRIEECDACVAETPHEVRIEIKTENEQAEHSSFSREPYRVSVCMECGEETVRRMNDA
ncbi:hypothetical protein [Haladaptatus sp. CMAA 1911]|uniref:DUF7835 family putative zinc beta-ribbon protein n=1 Tax=unclassified Haladaptatus TaxID=2622732 RepID=UPI00375495C0